MTNIRALCVALALCAASSARANVIFTLANNPQPNEENILLTAGDTGSSVSGTTNQTGLNVTFTSSQTLVVPTGATSITGDEVPLTDVSIALTDGGSSSDYIVNFSILSTCSGCAGNTATVSVDSLLNGLPDGTFDFPFTLGNGNNFLTITTAGGESIGSIAITAPQGFSSLSSLRISGPYTGVTAAAEPATLALLGLGLAGLGFARRRNQSRDARQVADRAFGAGVR